MRDVPNEDGVDRLASCRRDRQEAMAATEDSVSLFLKLISACKHHQLDTIRQVANERPKLLLCHDKHHRNVLHYASILTDESDGDGDGDENEASVFAEAQVKKSNQLAHQRPASTSKERTRRCLDCFRFLLDACSRIAGPERLARLWSRPDLDGLTTLHLAVISCNEALAREIIQTSSSAPVACDTNQRPTEGGQCQPMRPVLKSLVWTLDKEQHSPLHWAVITNSLNCVRLLVHQAGVALVHQADMNGATPLHYATQTSDYPRYRRQLRQMLRNATGSTNQSHEARDRLGDCGRNNVSVEFDRPLVAMREARQAGRHGAILRRGNSAPVDELGVESSGDTSPVGSRKRATHGRQLSPLAAANERARDEDGFQVLIYLSQLDGINLECRDRDSRTPLLWAASSGNRRALAILLSAGADSLSQDANQLGPLHCAASHGFIECLECLLESGPLVAQPAQATNKRAPSVDQPDSLQCTPLFYAVLSGSIDCVELLLERGANADWQDLKGRTAAHFAALKGQLHTLKLLAGELGRANLWLANKQGDLPLHYAIKSGRQQVVSWLLECSPYERAVNAINNSGRAPIHLAVMRSNPQMVDFLIRQGANLNQLVKVRDETGSMRNSMSMDEGRAAPSSQVNALVARGPRRVGYHYETALDMARRLSAKSSCLKLLEAAAAQSATEVLAQRQLGRVANGPARSIFDLRAAHALPSSPIGFETTSGSSAEPQSEHAAAAEQRLERLPRLPPNRLGPRRDSATPVQQSSEVSSSSAASSALSQSSLTSLRTSTKRALPPESASSPSGQLTRPFKGGMKYANEYMNASIKCKLYNQEKSPKARSVSQANGPKSAEQEIVTNVNVFTSPIHHEVCKSCARSSAGAHHRRRHVRNHFEESDSTTTSTTGSDELSAREPKLTMYVDQENSLGALETCATGAQYQEPLAPPRRMPFSRAYTEHLPVILSAEEERSTSGETVNTLGDVSSAPMQHQNQQRQQRVLSPVADYISSPAAYKGSPRSKATTDWRQQQTRGRVVDYSRVRAKVDSHRYDSGLSSQYDNISAPSPSASRRSKSWSTPSSSSASGQQLAASMEQKRSAESFYPGSPPTATKGASMRVTQVQTHRQQRRSSAEAGTKDAESAISIERSIWRYKQESKLFEELQNLKRSQIRSGRANETLLVKRLAERFRNDASQQSTMLALDPYRGPYTYNAYELYLYDQLRRLSPSNERKLTPGLEGRHSRGEHVADLARGPIIDEASRREQSSGSRESARERDYFEEDLSAELELQRVLSKGGEAPAEVEPKGSGHESFERSSVGPTPVESFLCAPPEAPQENHLELSGCTPEETVAVKSLVSQISSASSSRRSSVEVEREKLDCLPLRVATTATESPTKVLMQANEVVEDDHGDGDPDAKEAHPRQSLEVEASNLSASIITDALGNISRAESRASTPVEGEQVTATGEGASMESQGSIPVDLGQVDGLCEGGVGTTSESAGERLADGSSGRRRSVVNIGNKIEIIYHNVGIEIGPLAEGDRDSGDEDEGGGVEVETNTEQSEAQAGDAEGGQTSVCDPVESGRVQAQEERQSQDKGSSESVQERVESHQDDTNYQLKANDGSNNSVLNERGYPSEQHEPDEVPLQQVSDSEVGLATAATTAAAGQSVGPPSDSLKTRTLTMTRRSSSPPAGVRLRSESIRIRPLTKRHASVSSGTVQPSRQQQLIDPIPMRKVFTGFDLDKLHARPRLLSRSRSQTHELNDEDRPTALRATSEASRKRARTRLRSQIPRGPYKVIVPIEQVEKRWREIKERELAKYRALVSHKEEHDERQWDPSEAETNGMEHSKSQPNLERKSWQDDSRLRGPSEGCSNFKLIYELNKQVSGRWSKANSENNNQDAGPTNKHKWCSRKAIKIVDVRTLKRTLSLPESVMYSNDLLKRFNVLKL